ncbi:SMP-30/gluconolactonase/LRE family protein [Caballeronia sp. LZ062]|uniref:SMP-30/gluconolactonase/LRE family protein n=1 Tax=unclassified Caballeronia TaxID=2646786 RepID=UPI0028610184|nr:MULTISPECIES: SMP-30/gluconolactonase/LRE family protein [unclassified Caballeronia]MDR5856065.1 SMP-30/gluconolactonase/LRE family protein [Caballeronia sp. LZ050]MDR5872736.1 SMP-30/gluconolactonase/LRE family protein [Caballeronia sp. LZ062]
MNSAPSVERLDAAGRATVGECPVWHAKDNALYFVDIPDRRIVRLDVESGRRADWTLPEQIACFAFDAAGTIVAGMESGLHAVTLHEAGEARLVRLAAPRFDAPGMRFNDGRCDRQGRFWAGTMVQDMALASPAGALYYYGNDGALSEPIVDGLVTQNGLAFSPDGATMYLSDSHPTRRLIWAFDFDVNTGTPSNRRVLADLHHHAGRPDGAAVDADGCYWTCANDAGRLLRFTPQGKLDRTIAMPAVKPSMCAFGGDDLATLYVTSIRPADNATDNDGCVFALRPGVQGLPEPEYAGMLPVA